MKKRILSCIQIFACLIGVMSVKTFAEDTFDYSPFEQYDAKSTYYSYEEDKFDSEWSSSIFMPGTEYNLVFQFTIKGDLDGSSVSVLGYVYVMDDTELKPDKLQFLIDDNVYTVEFSMDWAGFYFHGDNGKAFLEVLNNADEFSVRMKVDGKNYDDTFKKDSLNALRFDDFKFMTDIAVKQNAIDKIPSEYPELLEIIQPITVK